MLRSWKYTGPCGHLHKLLRSSWLKKRDGSCQQSSCFTMVAIVYSMATHNIIDQTTVANAKTWFTMLDEYHTSNPISRQNRGKFKLTAMARRWWVATSMRRASHPVILPEKFERPSACLCSEWMCHKQMEIKKTYSWPTSQCSLLTPVGNQIGSCYIWIGQIREATKLSTYGIHVFPNFKKRSAGGLPFHAPSGGRNRGTLPALTTNT